jgi:pilus assembly protein CpaB
MVFALVLLLGVGLAGFAVYMAQNYFAQLQVQRDQLLAAQASSVKLVDVVVFKRPLAYGERFTKDDLEVVKMQEGKVPEGVYPAIIGEPLPVAKGKGKPKAPAVPGAAQPKPQAAPANGQKAAKDGAPVYGVFLEGETRPRATLRSFEKYEPLLAKKITEPGVDAGINANLTAGMRAFAINVDVSSGVSGFLRPGDRVDVYWTGVANSTEVTKLIDQAVRLIAIDQSADADRSEETKVARTVTIEATPTQVAALAQAQSSGRLTLSLVGQGDQTLSEAVEIDQNTLLGITEEEVIQAEKPKVCTIRTNKGGEIVEVPIPCTE